MSAVPVTYLIVPTTEAPSQRITVTLNGQSCVISFYTKSINVPVREPGEIVTSPPRYENTNPCFIDLYTDSGATLIIGGVYVRQGSLIVRDTYLGFSGDLAVYDTWGRGEDPFGVPSVLPPLHLRNNYQSTNFPTDATRVPVTLAGRIPGLGSRWQLTYWFPGSYTPGYSLPR